jgi:hypothetical protein
LWDLRLNQGGVASFALPEGQTVSAAVLKGTVQVNGDAIAREAQLVLLDRRGGEITLEADSDASLLILSGEGHELDPETAALVPASAIDRMLSQEEGAALIRRLEARIPSGRRRPRFGEA